MSVPPDVRVALDDRVRLLSAVLAATEWPARAQARHPHGTTLYARATRKHVAELREHEAVRALQVMLDREVPLEAIFALAGQLTWPELAPVDWPRWAPREWPAQLRAFYGEAGLPAWWERERAVWRKGVDEAGRVLAGSRVRSLLAAFLGPLRPGLAFMPNLGDPSDREMGVRLGHELVALVPPRAAIGDSAPWPFDDDVAHVFRAGIMAWGRMLLVPYLRAHSEAVEAASRAELPVSDDLRARLPTWQDQFVHLLLTGLVAVYLADHVSKAEADAYVLVERKTQGAGMLPSLVSVLRHYQHEHAAGRYRELADFLPYFPRQLRVARRIVNM